MLLKDCQRLSMIALSLFPMPLIDGNHPLHAIAHATFGVIIIEQRQCLFNMLTSIVVAAAQLFDPRQFIECPCFTVAILFLEEMANYRLERVAAGFFLAAIGLLMWGLTLFLREIRIGAASLRIREDYLELHRDL